MRIIELLHGRTLREDGTDLTDPVSASGMSIAPGVGSAVGAHPPPGFGPTAPGYAKDTAGNWTHNGQPSNAMVGSGSLLLPAWQQAVSPAQQADNRRDWQQASDTFNRTGDISAASRFIDNNVTPIGVRVASPPSTR
jgi:hypothetical protein